MGNSGKLKYSFLHSYDLRQLFTYLNVFGKGAIPLGERIRCVFLAKLGPFFIQKIAN